MENSNENPYKTDGILDNYHPLSFYEKNGNQIESGFDTFEFDGKYYFTYVLSNLIYLISEGYNSAAGRDNGIESVRKNMSIRDRYREKEDKNGNYYFNLIAGNNQEIATSRWFLSQEGSKTAIGLLMDSDNNAESRTIDELVPAKRAGNISIEAAAPITAEDTTPKKRRKRRKVKKVKKERVYLRNGNYLFNEVTYQTFKSSNDKFYFLIKSKEDKTICFNSNVRGFETESDVDLALERFNKYAPFEKNYLGKTAKNGKFYFYIHDENEKNLAKSFFYDTQEKMQSDVGLLLGGYKVAPESTGNRVVDDYLPCDNYRGEIGFNKFKIEDEFYFSYCGSESEVFLRSEGYKTEAARDNGIASVEKNSPIEKRWTTGEALNGKYHYFALKAGNHQEIARSCYYNNTDELESAFGRFHETMFPTAVEEKKEKKLDDYLPCDEYKGENGFNKFKKEDEFYFSYVKDGDVFLRSEGYTTEAARDNGIASVKKNSPIKERWIEGEVLNGKYYYFALKAGNHQEIARSCYYKDKAGMLAGLGLIGGAFAVTSPPTVEKEEKVETPDVAIASPPVVEKEEKVETPIAAAAAVATAAVTSSVATAPIEPTPPKETEEKGGIAWWWWILLPLLLLALFFLYKSCNKGDIAAPIKKEVKAVEKKKADVAPLPSKKEEVKVVVTETPIKLPEIHYDYDKNNILAEENPELNEVLSIMKKYKDIIIEVGSHTDVRGSNVYNKNLSDRRSREAKQWLINHGIAKNRLVSKGYGETMVRNKCKEGVSCSDDEHRVNRRTEFTIISGTKIETVSDTIRVKHD